MNFSEGNLPLYKKKPKNHTFQFFNLKIFPKEIVSMKNEYLYQNVHNRIIYKSVNL